MADARLTQLRLTAFKSYRSVVMPLDPVTVLTGRNSAGKSNALDAIEVLSRLAGGEDLGDALDGRRREGGPVRGGSLGCAPHGTDEFELGCTVRIGNQAFILDVRVQVRPELRIVYERLMGPAPALESGLVERRLLLWTRPPEDGSMGLVAEVFNGKRGNNPTVAFRDSRLLTTQLPLRLLAQNDADEAVLKAADAVVGALRAVFQLDPVSHFMREYTPARNSDLLRNGENISAAIAKLSSDDPKTFRRLEELVRTVAGRDVRHIRFTSSDLGDVMLALQEGNAKALTPAREMSDGMLRFLAIATALLTSNRGLDLDGGLTSSKVASRVLLVIEELENGLHPSQAGRILELVRETSSRLGSSVLVTTHSPALLNAMTGHLNRSILVCYRDPRSRSSQLSRITELPGYTQAIASGQIGDVVSMGRMIQPEDPNVDTSEFNKLLGIE